MADESTSTAAHQSSPDKKAPELLIRTRTSSSSSSLSIKTPRTARFAEATSVNSPIGPTKSGRSPFAGAPINTVHLSPQAQPSDIGFGYMSRNEMSKHNSIEVPLTPRTPMKSALKPPGTPGRFIDPRSPTFKEEVALEEQEEKTDKQNAVDLKAKMRVRIAKFFLRGVNFGCSLIVLSMLSTTFQILNATRALPPRNGLPPWAQGQQTWPQITLLVIACISLAMCVIIFYSYWRGGHRKAEKTAIYYTVFALGFFLFSTVMWIIGAVVLHSSKQNGNGQDMWGWSCKNNQRATLFNDSVQYALVCRLQSWSLICAIIEITVEVICIVIYSIVFYRLWSKRKLHKSMNLRDKARSDLYLAQLRAQSAPNTPGVMKSPMGSHFGAHVVGSGDHDGDAIHAAEKGDYFDEDDAQYARKHHSFTHPKPFALQPPPVKIHAASPILEQDGFEHGPSAPGEQTYDAVPIPSAYSEPAPKAPGEPTYDSLPVPEAYASPLSSPSFQRQSLHFQEPPSSPRLRKSRLQ